MKYLKNKQQGFTIIETLIAITILMISIAGPLTIAHKGLSAATNAREQLTAVYLAQDALESVKNIRDVNMDNGANWLTGLSGCISGNPCVINTVDGTIPASNEAKLNMDSGGRYTHNAGNETIYSRYFYLEDVDPANGVDMYNEDEVRLVVVVSWENTLGIRTVMLYNRLFKVQL